jgi:uncharacterized protein YbbC (DUF1343 family)
MKPYFLPFLFFMTFFYCYAEVQLGIDCLFSKKYESLLRGKKIGLVTNHTAINGERQTSIELFKTNAKKYNFTLNVLFAPEHGLNGAQHAEEKVQNGRDRDGLLIYSLHGETRRPTEEMLKGLNLIVYDIQDIGSRSYTYISTLFYVMEEAAKRNIPVIVLDRPNPINGLTVDGPLLEDKWKSFVGYVNVPYCHGMTIGELAKYFNAENKVACNLTVIPMNGWNRSMTFSETGLAWIPTSPNIPEAETVFFYPTTGLLGELQMVNIGVGYTMPFKLVGAPWIDAKQFAKHLNEQKFPGVYFHPFFYRPFFGRFSHEDCEGVLIMVTDHKKYLPVSTQYLILGGLKSLYPVDFQKALLASAKREEMFNKVNGTAEVYRIIKEEKYVTWQLRDLHKKERSAFLQKRKAYLLPEYST